MEQTIEEIKKTALEAIATVADRKEIEAFSVRYLGRKGIVTRFLRNISTLPPEERPRAGKQANEVKRLLEKAVDAAIAKIDGAGLDDDPGIVSQLRLALRKEYEVFTAGDPDEAWRVVRSNRPDLMTLDLALDGVDPETGFSVLEKCIAFDPLIRIVMITGNF